MTNANEKTASVSEMPASDATIFAPATPPGASGVAVFRVSGQNIMPTCASLGLPIPLEPRQATLCTLRHPATGVMLDQALALFFPAPHSFTGEDVLELHTHGGSAIRALLLEALSALPGCRLAEPGEFSKRAFMNGKMDLLEAEGIADVIAAETPAQHHQALRQVSGDASKDFMALRARVVHSLALLEAYLDFPDEDIPEATLQEVNDEIDRLRDEIRTLLDAPPAGEIIRSGYTVAIVGPPNAGKSSLLNRLAQRDVAIVSDTPGTTRDRIEVDINLGGYLVRLIDTAGLRETSDVIEAEGIRRAREAAAEAQLTLLVVDIVSDTEQISSLLDNLLEDALIARNKCDQLTVQPADLDSETRSITISAQTGEGMEALLDELRRSVEQALTVSAPPCLTRARHREALQDARAALEHWEPNRPLELLAEELRASAVSIGKITGEISVDQLLDVVFREFCIGK